MPPAPYRPFGTFRLVLALAVAFDHGGWLVGGTLGNLIAQSRMGSAAVLGFFVLSGYILSEAAVCFYAGRWMALAANRALRIVPAFLGALVLSVAVHWIVTRLGLLQRGVAFEGIAPESQSVWATRNLLYNPFAIVPFMRPEEAWKYVGRIYLFVRYVWAINVEMTFYVVLSIYVALHPRSWRVWMAVGVIVGLAGGTLMATGALTRQSLEYYLFFAPFFCLGSAIYTAQRTRRWPAIALSLLFAVLSIVHGFRFIGTVGGDAIFIAMLATLLRLSAAESMVISKVADRRFGDLSYSVYLNQYAVLVAISAAGLPSGVGSLVAGMVVIVLVSALLQLLIERPLSSLRAAVRGATL